MLLLHFSHVKNSLGVMAHLRAVVSPAGTTEEFDD